MLNPRPISFAGAAAVNRHLDSWAERDLADPAGWDEAIASTRWWLDYSTRNQLLLASYGASGPVAGFETWRLVPSTSGRECSVAAGEHPLPVRVPITAAGEIADPHVGRRPSVAVAQDFEWRGVFCVDQLARRPAIDQLTPGLPDELTGSAGERRFAELSRSVAKRSIRGRLPAGADPADLWVTAVARNPRSAGRPALDEVLAGQAVWLISDRLGHAPGPMPGFDPGGLSPRERWETLADVLEPGRRLLGVASRELGTDLCATALPRIEIDDGEAVPAGRRNRLSRASLAQLPEGRWVEVGPYNSAEWQARGERADGRGAYLRLNSTAYLVAVERGGAAGWRLEDVRSPVGAGVLAAGPARDLDDAQATAVANTSARYPQLVEDHLGDDLTTGVASPAHPETGTPQPPLPVTGPVAATGPAPTPDSVRPNEAGWESFEDRADSPARRRHFGEGVWAYVLPIDGGRWLPLVGNGQEGGLTPMADAATQHEAFDAVELTARRLVTERHRQGGRVGFDDTVAAVATTGRYDRAALVDLVGDRLDPGDGARLTLPDLAPDELVELLQRAGVTPTTTVLVLAAEHVDAVTVAGLLPIVGIPASEGITQVAAGWDLTRGRAAELVGATAGQMRTAGCTASEILAARPVEALAGLPRDPHVWDLAAGTMATNGTPADDIAALLATHAPTPDCLAAGLAATVDDDVDDGYLAAIDLAVRHRVPPEALAALSERLGQSPYDLAEDLVDTSAPLALAVPALWERCDQDPVLTTQLVRSAFGVHTETVAEALTAAGIPIGDDVAAELRAAAPLSKDRHAWLNTMRPATGQPSALGVDRAELDRALDTLPAPNTRSAGELPSPTTTPTALPSPTPDRTPDLLEID